MFLELVAIKAVSIDINTKAVGMGFECGRKGFVMPPKLLTTFQVHRMDCSSTSWSKILPSILAVSVATVKSQVPFLIPLLFLGEETLKKCYREDLYMSAVP